MAVGYIYILSNAAHGDLLKIGFTCGSVEGRAAELSSTGVPHPFEIEFFQLTEEVEEVEKMVHAELQANRPNASREFFRLPLLQAIGVIEKHVRAPTARYARERPPPGKLTECRRCGHSFAKTLSQRLCPSCGF
jgi:hypothetical protein